MHSAQFALASVGENWGLRWMRRETENLRAASVLRGTPRRGDSGGVPTSFATKKREIMGLWSKYGDSRPTGPSAYPHVRQEVVPQRNLGELRFAS